MVYTEDDDGRKELLEVFQVAKGIFIFLEKAKSLSEGDFGDDVQCEVVRGDGQVYGPEQALRGIRDVL